MHFNLATLVTISAFLTTTAFASPLQSSAEIPTRASLNERADRTVVPPGCWSGTAFPPRSAWSPYPEAFVVAKGAMEYGNDTKAEIAAIHKAIIDVSEESGFDRRFILAIMRRESDGETTIPCGDNGKSCGLMQVHGVNVPHCARHPCPDRAIHKMIKCGVMGCQGSSIADCAARYGHDYPALARCYNTGTVPDASDYTRDAGIGVRTYVQDVANLLLGSDYATWSSFDNGECRYVNSS